MSKDSEKSLSELMREQFVREHKHAAKIDRTSLADNSFGTLLRQLYHTVIPSTPLPSDNPYQSIAITEAEFPQQYGLMKTVVEHVVRQQLAMYEKAQQTRSGKFALLQGDISPKQEQELFQSMAKRFRNSCRGVLRSDDAQRVLFSADDKAKAAKAKLMGALSFIHDVAYHGLKEGHQLGTSSVMVIADHPRTIADIIDRQNFSPERVEELVDDVQKYAGLQSVLPPGLESSRPTTTQHTGAPTRRETSGRPETERDRPTLKIPRRKPSPPSES